VPETVYPSVSWDTSTSHLPSWMSDATISEPFTETTETWYYDTSVPSWMPESLRMKTKTSVEEPNWESISTEVSSWHSPPTSEPSWLEHAT
jgi:hypothetical protein